MLRLARHNDTRKLIDSLPWSKQRLLLFSLCKHRRTKILIMSKAFCLLQLIFETFLLFSALAKFLSKGRNLLFVFLLTLAIFLIQQCNPLSKVLLLSFQVILLVKEFLLISLVVIYEFTIPLYVFQFIASLTNLCLAILHDYGIGTSTFQFVQLLLLQLLQFSISFLFANLRFRIYLINTFGM